MDVLPVIVEGLRAFAGFILLLLIPGFFLSLVFFPRLSEIRPIERLAYSAVLSICSVLIIVVVMDLFLGVNTTQRNVTLFILVFSIFAFVVWLAEIQFRSRGLKWKPDLPLPWKFKKKKYLTFPTNTYQMQFCTACGAKAAAGNKFCGKCGAPLEQDTEPVQAATVPHDAVRFKSGFWEHDTVPAAIRVSARPGTPVVPEAALSPSPAEPLPPSEKVPPVKKGVPVTTLIIGAVAVMVILSVVSVAFMPMMKAEAGATNVTVPTPPVTSAIYSRTVRPTPGVTTIPPVIVENIRDKELYEQIYSLQGTFAYNTTVFNYTLTQPPLYIRFSLNPKMVNRSHLAGIGTNNEHWANTTTVSPNAWFEVNIFDAGTGECIEQQGYGILNNLSDVTQQSFKVWKAGDYRIEISGNDVEADLQVLVDTDLKEPADIFQDTSDELPDLVSSPDNPDDSGIDIPSLQSPLIRDPPESTGSSCGLTMKDEGLAAVADEPVFLWWFKDQVDSEGNTVSAPVSRLTSYLNSHTAEEAEFPADVTSRINDILASEPTKDITSCELKNATKDYIAYLQNMKKVSLPALKGIERADRLKYWANVTSATDIDSETRKLYNTFVTIKGYAVQ